MRLRRRRPEAHPSQAPVVGVSLSDEADRVERAVRALAMHAEQLEDRLAKLEARVNDVERRALEAPKHALANLMVVGVEIDAMAVAAEAAEIKGELTTDDGYVLADALAAQVAGLADSLDALAATLAASTQTVPTLRALPNAS
ncbi:MAG: hypothetical protein Q8K63_09030 [Acidimicrobiales bacterium]|nr:hypothetical protein [Acidimicrobiales bacterium]